MTSLPRIEIEVKSYAYRFYIKHKDNYDCSLQMFVEGEDAFIHTLNGNRFFEVLPIYHKEIFPPGIKYLHFTMMELTLLKLKSVMDDYYEFDVGKQFSKNGRVFYKVKVSVK